MNDKIQEMLDTIQRTAVQAGDVASDAAYGVGKKAAQLLSTAKLNIRVCECKADIAAAFRELGEMLYATHAGSPTDSDDLLHKLENIDALKAQLNTLNAQLNRQTPADAHTCPICGSAAKEGDQFCRECGSPLAPKTEETSAEGQTASAEAQPQSAPADEEQPTATSEDFVD